MQIGDFLLATFQGDTEDPPRIYAAEITAVNAPDNSFDCFFSESGLVITFRLEVDGSDPWTGFDESGQEYILATHQIYSAGFTDPLPDNVAVVTFSDGFRSLCYVDTVGDTTDVTLYYGNYPSFSFDITSILSSDWDAYPPGTLIISIEGYVPTDSLPGGQVAGATFNGCSKSQITTVEDSKIWKLVDSATIIFKANMSIDADGSPRAYGPDDSGLDINRHAQKRDGTWNDSVLELDSDNQPVIQSDTDPAPGFYICYTSLRDKNLASTNPLKYTNSETVPYIALPADVRDPGKIKIGDLAYVYHIEKQVGSYAIYADGGPAHKVGEGSMRLSAKLGMSSNPRNGGTGKPVILYIVFSSSGKGQGTQLTEAEIDIVGKAALDAVGGMKLVECLLQSEL